jgi:LPXTG-motif cell wall-anchored protein
LEQIALTDDVLGPVTCPATTLAPDASMTCTVTGTAAAGQYENVATVTGVFAGATVTDTDPSHYFGEAPAVDIEKFVNGDDADLPPGPLVSVGDPVKWTYVVTNTGNIPLVTWSVTDDQGFAIACPRIGLLVPGQSVICFVGQAPAEEGLNTNIGTVNATSLGGTPVTDSDPANYFGIQGAIHLEKSTNGEDADDPPGPFITPGEPVTWTYVVTNEGNTPLSDVVLTDFRLLAAPPVFVGGDTDGDELLDVDETWTYTASAAAEEGEYTNFARVVGLTLLGVQVADTDPSHYFGAAPGVAIKKFTNGDDADEAPGPFIPVGAAVEWTYVVTNTGNQPLVQVAVTDDQGVAVTCPQDTLPVGGEMICTASGVAEIGEYANVGTVTADPASEVGVEQVLSASDPSHYFGAVSAIELVKFANGEDANEPPGITVPAGPDVTMTFVVTNPGNVAIRGVTLTDDKGLVPTFVGGDDNANGDLDPGETWTYEATAGPASGDNLNNIGTVTAVDVMENPLTASDPANINTGQPTGGGQLPATGAESFPLVLLAMVLIVSGTGMLLTGRRFAH